MIPAIGRTMTPGFEMETVPRGTPALLPTPPEGAPTTPADVDVLADARPEAHSWSPNTRRAYVAGWRDLSSWCLENRCAGLPQRQRRRPISGAPSTITTNCGKRWLMVPV